MNLIRSLAKSTNLSGLLLVLLVSLLIGVALGINNIRSLGVDFSIPIIEGLYTIDNPNQVPENEKNETIPDASPIQIVEESVEDE